MFFTAKTQIIITCVTAIAGATFGLISLIDQLVNADRRAILTGTATGDRLSQCLCNKEEKKEE